MVWSVIHTVWMSAGGGAPNYTVRRGENGSKLYGSLLGVASSAVVLVRFVLVVHVIVACSIHLSLDGLCIGFWP